MFFVTFWLADSLPQAKLIALSRERKAWLTDHPDPHDDREKAEYYRLFSVPQQKWLDAGYGSMLLRDEPVRKIVEQALKHFDGSRYRLDEFVVAANHVHALVVPSAGVALSSVLHGWKGYSGREIKKLARARGDLSDAPIWQQESWDHIVRSEASLEKFRRYIRSHD